MGGHGWFVASFSVIFAPLAFIATRRVGEEEVGLHVSCVYIMLSRCRGRRKQTSLGWFVVVRGSMPTSAKFLWHRAEPLKAGSLHECLRVYEMCVYVLTHVMLFAAAMAYLYERD
jgi:hypothetical protein